MELLWRNHVHASQTFKRLQQYALRLIWVLNEHMQQQQRLALVGRGSVTQTNVAVAIINL